MAGFKGNYLGYEIEIPAEECHAVSVMKYYWQLGQEVIKRYEKLYQGYQNFQTFADRGIRDGYAMLDNCLRRTADKLVQDGHYDVNRETLLDRYGDDIYQPWTHLEDLIDQVLELGNQQIEQSQEYREIRKACRGRVVGGGFGLKAAIGGMATAGALNALSGIVHSGVNAVGNARTRVAVNKQLNDLYQNDLLQSVQAALTECIRNMGLAVLSYQNCLKTEYIMGGTKEDLSRAKALRENYQKVPQDKRPGIAVEILKLNPLNIDTYELLLKEYKDPDGTLMALANALSMKEDYDKILQQIVQNELSDITRPLGETIRTLANDPNLNISKLDALKLETQQQAQSIFESYGIKEGDLDIKRQFTRQLDEIFTSEFHQIIERRSREKLNCLSQKIRELKVEELDTPIVQKLINDTQEEEQEIFKKLGIAKSHNDLLLGYCSEAEKIALAEVEDAKERDLTDRTFRGKTYATVVQAEKAKQLWSAFVAAYEWIGPNSSIEEIESSLSKMSKLEKQAPRELLDEMQERIQEVKQNRDEVDAAERTFLDITFNTKEERIEAEKQYQMLREEFQKALNDNSISSLELLEESIRKRADICAPITGKFIDAIENQKEVLENRQKEKAVKKRKKAFAAVLFVANIGYILFTAWSFLTQDLFSTVSGEKACTLDLYQMSISDTPNIPDSVQMIWIGVVLILLGVIIVVRQVLKNDEDIFQIPLWVLMSALIMWGLIALLSTTYVVTRAYFVVLIVSLIFSILDSKLGNSFGKRYIP